MTDRELMQQTLYTLEHFYENGYDREDCFAAITALRERLAQPEQSSLDRMAENARELRLDYEPPMEDLRVQQSAWDNIPQEFNDWWNEDYDDSTNPFKLNSSAYWAWAGWQARRKKLAQPEQEPVAWVWKDGTLTSDPDRADGTWTPLYTTPPRREWQGLTEEEFSHGIQMASNTSWMKAAKWVEAKLKEKNA